MPKESVSEAQINAWKRSYGAVYEIALEGHKGYFRSPDRKILGLALSEGAQDPMAYHEVIARNCWLGGAPALLDDDTYFLSICMRLGELVEWKEAVLKKL